MVVVPCSCSALGVPFDVDSSTSAVISRWAYAHWHSDNSASQLASALSTDSL